MICWFKQEECSHLMPASLVYSKSVIECLLHCLLNIPRNIGDAFFFIIIIIITGFKTTYNNIEVKLQCSLQYK